MAPFAPALLVLSLLVSPAAAGEEPSIKDSYVVVLKDDVAQPDAATDESGRRAGFVARLRYAAAIKGFAADLTPAQVAFVTSPP